MNSFKYSNSNKRYHTLDYYYKNRFNEKVFKVSLNAGFTCPNIDGTKGSDGRYTSINSINGADMKNFAANAGGVDANISKQVSELKKNTDSMMQKEEIKQQEAKASSSGENK